MKEIFEISPIEEGRFTGKKLTKIILEIPYDVVEEALFPEENLTSWSLN